jgi:hypothetical protein
MHRHELDDLTDAFVTALQDKLPPHLSSFGPATPDRLREACRAHVEGIVGAEPGKALEKVAPLVAELLGVLSVAPAPLSTSQPVPAEATPVKAQAKK